SRSGLSNAPSRMRDARVSPSIPSAPMSRSSSAGIANGPICGPVDYRPLNVSIVRRVPHRRILDVLGLVPGHLGIGRIIGILEFGRLLAVAEYDDAVAPFFLG